MLIEEKVARRVDSCGRVSLPKHLRAKFEIDVGDEVEFYIYRTDNGKRYICLKKKEDNEIDND
jgi:AbrB family looped-hinge helix DNA binding protein